MNKKGFTLVELLATIAILVLMSLIIGVNITSILKSTEDNEKEFDKNTIEKAACVFADSEVRQKVGFTGCGGSNCTVNISLLVQAGLLNSDYSDIEKYPNRNVSVIYTDGEKTCTYD